MGIVIAIIIFGLPEIALLNFEDISDKCDIITSRHTKVKIGTTPIIIGILTSSIGSVAMLDISIVITSSEGCNSPI